MAQIANRSDLIAGRYDGLPAGPSLIYTFESQEGIPVDGGNPLLRTLSPFTIRLIAPKLLESSASVDVNLIGRANQSMEDNQRASDEVRSLFGIRSVTGSSSKTVLGSLQQVVSAGQVISGATSTTERAVLTDAVTAADIAFQVERILEVPPLTLLVNPSEMSVTYGEIQQYTNRGRHGMIFERWGEAQPTISFSGSTGAFIAAQNFANAIPGQANSSSPSGVQFASKRDSAAFQNFQSLYLLYRNSALIIDSINRTWANLMVGGVAIDYDQVTYVGSFNSFEYSYKEETPHRIEWSMDFTVAAMYDFSDDPIVVHPMGSPQGTRYGNLPTPDAALGSPSTHLGSFGESIQMSVVPFVLLTPRG